MNSLIHFIFLKRKLMERCVIFAIFLVFCFVLFEVCFHKQLHESYRETPGETLRETTSETLGEILEYDATFMGISLDSINLGLDFFATVEEGDILLDVLVGMRMFMEQAKLISTYLTRKGGYENDRRTLEEMIRKSNDPFDKHYSALLRTQVEFMNDLSNAVSPNAWSHWTLDSHCVNPNLRYDDLIDSKENPMGSDLSNDCLTMLYKHKCTIDDHCWHIMTYPGSQQYYLSHQLMFTMLAEKHGCTDRMNYHIEKSGQQSLLNVRTMFCSNMFNETTVMAEYVNGPFGENFRDLFMEDGFHQFTDNKDWLLNMIKWQDASGCWSLKGTEEYKNNRPKRTDKLIGSNKCSLHLTTVALGAIIVNIRNDFIKLLEPLRNNC